MDEESKLCTDYCASLLLEISAKAEWVSIVELRQQVDEMGRWIQTIQNTYGRQIEVDVLPMTEC